MSVDPTKPGKFSINAGWLCAILGMIATASLGTLSVVATVKNVDTLSTVALALAILAFVAQIISVIAQEQSGAVQIARVERLNSDAQSALADIRATSQSVLTNQREQFSQVLRVALERVRSPKRSENLEEGEEPVRRGDSQLEQTGVERYDEAVIQRIIEGRNSYTPPVDEILIRRFYSKPSEEYGTRVIIPVIEAFTIPEALGFSRWSRMIFENVQNGEPPTITLSQRRDQGGYRTTLERLTERGLFRTVIDERRIFVQLTDLGIEVASITLTVGGSPDWVIEAYARMNGEYLPNETSDDSASPS